MIQMKMQRAKSPILIPNLLITNQKKVIVFDLTGSLKQGESVIRNISFDGVM